MSILKRKSWLLFSFSRKKRNWGHSCPFPLFLQLWHSGQCLYNDSSTCCNVCVLGRVLTIPRHSLKSSWESSKSTQFWPNLPGDSARSPCERLSPTSLPLESFWGENCSHSWGLGAFFGLGSSCPGWRVKWNPCGCSCLNLACMVLGHLLLIYS